MNLPNKLTIARMALIPVFVVLLMAEGPVMQVWAAAVFVVASLTDLLDGYIARSRNLVTDFGKFMDPIADKLLVMAALVELVAQGRMPAWVAMLLLAREFVVSGVRLVAASKGRVIAAGPLGKVKTASQMLAIVLLILGSGAYAVFPPLRLPAEIIIYASAVLSTWSLVDYIARNKEVLKA